MMLDDVPYSHLSLTLVDRDVLVQVRLGHSNADIARMRRCSVGTAAKQVTRMLRKFGVTTRRELMALLRDEVDTRVPGQTGIDSNAPIGLLSDREREVWIRVQSGLSNKTIAAELGLAPSTIGVLLCRARAKLR